MAKTMSKKIINNSPKRKINNGFFSRFKFSESYTSLILGAIVVLIAGILVISFAKINRNMQTSSVKDFIKINEQDLRGSNTSSTYTVKPGDDLWTISVNVYNNGYKWVEIAKINNLQNPGLIHAGNKLVIPTDTSENKITINSNNQVNTGSEISNNSIAGNTYMIKKGDDLWDISVRAYGDGFKWPEIAKANNLDNPDLIFSGNILIIPR